MNVSCHAFVYLSRLSSFQDLKPRICVFCLFLHFLFDSLIVEFSLLVSAMFLISIYMEIVKRFNEGLWDARSCSHSDVKQHFDDCAGLGAEFPTFYTLYLIQFLPEMAGDKIIQTGRGLLSCAYTTQLLHSTVEVCWNNNDSYFIWIIVHFVCGKDIVRIDMYIEQCVSLVF